MDAVECKSTVLEYIRKYRAVLLVLIIGAFLMLTPEKEQEPPSIPPEISEEKNLETELTQLISKIYGAGKTEVLLTESAGAQTYYQTNEDVSSREGGTDQHKDTVLISNGSREETGLIRRIDPPVYQGAVILCQGADNAQVCLSIVEAVANATGLSTDKITVLKMK